MSYMFPGSGDANQDGVVDIGDAAYIASAVVGLPGFTLNEYMDINNDGQADIGDAAYIASAVVGLPGFTLPSPIAPTPTPIQPSKLFELKNVTATGAELVFNKDVLPSHVSGVGAFEIEFSGVSLDSVTVPTQLQNAFFMNGPQRFALADSAGIQLDQLPSSLTFNMGYTNGTPTILEDKTRLWDSTTTATEIVVQ